MTRGIHLLSKKQENSSQRLKRWARNAKSKSDGEIGHVACVATETLRVKRQDRCAFLRELTSANFLLFGVGNTDDDFDRMMFRKLARPAEDEVFGILVEVALAGTRTDRPS